MATFASANVATENWDSEDSDVEVTVAEETEINLRPESLVYEDLQPGSSQEVSDNADIQFDRISVENRGSTRINQMWLETSLPSQKGFGAEVGSGESGDDVGFNTGNFMRVTPDHGDNDLFSGEGNPMYVNRRDFIERDNPPFIETGEAAEEVVGAEGDHDVTFVGRFRDGSEETFYVITSDSDFADDTLCNGDNAGGANLVVADQTISTADDAVDFTEESEVTEETIENIDGEDNHGIASSVDVNGESYDLLTRCEIDTDDEPVVDGSYIVRNRYNMDPDFIAEDVTLDDTTSTATFILDTSDSTNMFQPGQMAEIGVSVEVPNGVTTGDIDEGSLTLYATQDPDHNVDTADGGDDIEETGDLQ